MKMESGKTGMKILIAVFVVVILVAAALLGLKIYQDQTKDAGVDQTGEIEQGKVENPITTKEVEIYQGDERPIAVMIDNHKDAWPHAGLNEAYAVYEIIVEGGESRLMAVFKGKDISKIGPIRSARHYFLDYALENDALYVHYGQSPQADSDIKKLGVQNVNGLIYSNKDFWRVKDKKAPHNAVTSTDNILNIAKNKKKYRTTSSAESVLNYTVEEVNLEGELFADTVTIPYSDSNTVKYEYNPETKRYVRYSRNKVQTDWETKEEVTTKNIIITFVKNATLNDGENKGRQTISNIKTADGYYITNGKAIKITCEKTARDKQTIYRDLNGNEIEVNDGNTFFQICPIDANVKIEGVAPVTEGETQNTVQ